MSQLTKGELAVLEELLRRFEKEVGEEAGRVIRRAQTNDFSCRIADHVTPQLCLIKDVIVHVHAKWLSRAAILLLLFSLSSARAFDTNRFLWALAQVESGGRTDAIGRAGEVSAYQLSRTVILAHIDHVPNVEPGSSDPSERVRKSPGLAREIARRVIIGLRSRLAARLHREPTAAEILASYQLGLAGFESRGFTLANCPAAVQDAAQRLNNLLWQCQEAPP